MRRQAMKFGVRIMIIMVIIITFPAVPIPFRVVSMGSAVPDHILLTWSEDPQTTQLITWRMDIGAEDGFVQYVEDLKDLPFPYDVRSVTSTVEKLTTNAVSMSIHSVNLTRLKPDTRYYYRVGYGNIWTGWRPFTTAPAENKDFTFLVLGKPDRVSYDTWGETLHQAYQYYPKAAFFINAGTLVDDEQDYMQWAAWFKAAKGIVDTLPIMPISGASMSENQASSPNLYNAMFKVPYGETIKLKEQAYSKNYGDVHFIMIKISDNPQQAEYRELLKWLDQDLSKTNKKWKVAVISNDILQEELSKLFGKYQVDIVFTGNKAIYSHIYSLQGNTPSFNMRQRRDINSIEQEFPANSDNASILWDAVHYQTQPEPFFLAVTVKDDVMNMQISNQHGYPINYWSIEKCCIK